MSSRASPMASHALASGLIGEEEIRQHQQLLSQLVEEQVQAAMKKVMADMEQSTRTEIDMLRRECDTLRRDIQATTAQMSVAPAQPPPAQTMVQMPQMPNTSVDLRSSPEFYKIDQRVRTMEDAFDEWQVKERLSFVAVGMLALQASRLEENEKEASMKMLEDEERALTAYLGRNKGSLGPAPELNSTVPPFLLPQTGSTPTQNYLYPQGMDRGSSSSMGNQPVTYSPSPSGDWWKGKLGR
mmetsp:Transcript_150166/g.273369  ORF Transcript_150166/g.273369 Transcript_150166/m.273369 type:complete len:241 (-) Transcript_150166:179-901(-)